MLILIFGIQLAYASRNANTQFRVSFLLIYINIIVKKLLCGYLFFSLFVFLQERTFLVASILLEFIVSFSYYIIRDWYLSELNPTTLFLALFIRSQLTCTISMILIFLPKIYYQHQVCSLNLVIKKVIIFVPLSVHNC